MPGQFRKAPPPRSSSSTTGRIQKSRPAPTPTITRRPPVTPRIPNKVTRRAVNVTRTEQRVVRRQATREQINKVQPRPRPVVRPTTPPVKNMPRRPAPPPTPLKRITKSAPSRLPSASAHPKSMSRGVAAAGVAAAGAVAAGALLSLNASAAAPDISLDVNSLQSTLADLQDRSNFSDISADLTNLDATINNVLNLLESARDKGYVYQSDMEDIAYAAADRWQSVRGQVEAAIPQQIRAAQNSIDDLNPYIQRLNANIRNASAATSSLKAAQDRANQILWDLQQAENALEANYDGIENDIRQLNSRLTTIHWALDQLAEAHFKVEKGEDLVMAVPNRWDKEGKDDPEGVLFLTNKHLIFERKEKIATKKVLFVTTASELVQEVLFNQALNTIASAKAQNKGLFGHQDFLEVQFSDGKLGTLSLHINGQDSKQWVNLIERAKSGQIEEERTSGSGLSFSDLTGPLTNADLLEIQNEFNELQDELALKDVHSDLGELENEVNTLGRDLAALRARGYAVEKSLEADLQILTSQWEQVKSRVETAIENQQKSLNECLAGLKDGMSRLMSASSSSLAAARPQYIAMKSAMASAEAQAEAAEDTVLDMYDEYADEVEALSTHFEWVDWMLEAISTASFRLLATESGVAATEAVWLRPGLEPENGILYLTDQRLLWEDRVDEFELKIDVPLQQVSEARETSTEEAEFDEITVTFDGAEAPVKVAQFQLALPVAEDWLQMIGRARAGDYASDRAVELDQNEIERIRNAPQQCSNCGAAFTAPVLRGQNEIACEYCGVVTRI
jgi:predicted  nucleic acid-binding Zn-ribbon protein